MVKCNLLTSVGVIETVNKIIDNFVNLLPVYVSTLYDCRNSADMQTISSFIDDLTKVPFLAKEKRNVCEGILRYEECYNVLQTFQKNKSPGNNGLTPEFYLAFWPLLGKLVVDSLNYAFEYGELSNSQKQAVITLIEKKGKDKRLVKNWRQISPVNVDVILYQAINL